MATDVTSNRNMTQTMISERKKTMISKMQFMNSVLGKPVVDAVVQTLYNQSNDFPAIYEAYLAAVEKMRAVLGPDAKREIQKYTHMIEGYFGSRISMDQWEGCFFVKDWKTAPIPEENLQDTICLREEIWNDAAV